MNKIIAIIKSMILCALSLMLCFSNVFSICAEDIPQETDTPVVEEEAQNQASDILGNATTQANEVYTSAKNKSREMLNAVNNYADDTLLAIDDALYKALTDVRRIRDGISDVQNKNR